jgi:hypothetical protein
MRLCFIRHVSSGNILVSKTTIVCRDVKQIDVLKRPHFVSGIGADCDSDIVVNPRLRLFNSLLEADIEAVIEVDV